MGYELNLLFAALGSLLAAGVLVFLGFALTQRAASAGKEDLLKVLSGFRADAQKERKSARDDYRYLVNLLSAREPMAMQQLEQISQMTNPPAPPPEPEGPLQEDLVFPSDYDEALAEAQRRGVKLPEPVI